MRIEMQRLLSLLVFGSAAACASDDASAVNVEEPETLRQEASDTGADAADAALDFPDPKDVIVTITGDEGCGNFGQVVGLDGSSYTVMLDAVSVEQSEGSQQSLACTLSLRYQFPAGWTFDAPQTIVRGFAQTDERAAMRLRFNTSLGGQGVTTSRSFRSSTREDFVLALDDASAAPGGSVPCGATSTTVMVRLEGSALGAGIATLNVDSVDGRINWRRCE